VAPVKADVEVVEGEGVEGVTGVEVVEGAAGVAGVEVVEVVEGAEPLLDWKGDLVDAEGNIIDGTCSAPSCLCMILISSCPGRVE
jgi:hypothetical protein